MNIATKFTPNKIPTKDVSLEDKYLSDESRMLVCEKLCNEIQVYKRILNISINLSTKQLEESLLVHSLCFCPLQV